MLRKLFFAAILAGNLLVFTPVWSAGPPEFNPICWKKCDCAAVREKITKKAVDCEGNFDGFVTDASICPPGSSSEPWGKCLAGGQAKTEISFFGERNFSSIGDFLIKGYRWAIAVASIIAVIMIILAGFQWSTSGGNSETISSSKNKIQNAIIGLFITFGSYTILNTINPELVNLNAINVWMVRPMEAVPEFCSASTSSLFALAADSTPEDQLKKLTFPGNLSYELKFDKNNETTFFCGKRFFIKDGGEKACFGDYCNSGTLCAKDLETDKLPYTCQKGNILGSVINSSAVSGETVGQLSRIVFGMPAWDNPPLRSEGLQKTFNDFELIAVCDKRSNYIAETFFLNYFPVANVQIGEYVNGKQSLKIEVPNDKLDEASRFCENLKGFAINLGFNGLMKLCFARKDWTYSAEQHVIGRNGVDLGDTFYWFWNNSSKINNSYFFTAEEIKKGFVLNIDAANVHTFWCDTEGDSPAHINSYGYLLNN